MVRPLSRNSGECTLTDDTFGLDEKFTESQFEYADSESKILFWCLRTGIELLAINYRSGWYFLTSFADIFIPVRRHQKRISDSESESESAN